MRINNPEKFEKSKSKYDVVKFKLEPIKRKPFVLVHNKDKIKFIKTVERIARSSMEYRTYIKFLKDNVDMTKCTYFNGVTNVNKKISIEIHHEPFTLFDITQIVVEKNLEEGVELNPLMVAKEVMMLHYMNLVGLLPLSVTVHELVHSGRIFVPLQILYGKYLKFLEKYEKYISEDLKSLLRAKLELSRDLSSIDNSVLETQYVYMEVDGILLPQIMEEKKNK